MCPFHSPHISNILHHPSSISIHSHRNTNNSMECLLVFHPSTIHSMECHSIVIFHLRF